MWSSYKVCKPEELNHAMDGTCLTEHDDSHHYETMHKVSDIKSVSIDRIIVFLLAQSM